MTDTDHLPRPRPAYHVPKNVRWIQTERGWASEWNEPRQTWRAWFAGLFRRKRSKELP